MKNLMKRLDDAGAKYAEVRVADIRFEPEFRKACESNACGFYGQCWTCPPDAGDIGTLIAKVRQYERALVFQTISALEDSFDIEGMQEASKRHNRLTIAVQEDARKVSPGCLVLGAGACGICERCAKRDNLPCRFPEKAVVSLEACGIAVSELAALCGLKYINGQNTVTYFGAVFY